MILGAMALISIFSNLQCESNFDGDWIVSQIEDPPSQEKPEKRPDSVHWISNFNEAKAEASRSGKDIFLVFTGDTWCHACALFQNEIIEEPRFGNEAGTKFVFVKVTVPKRPYREEEARTDPNKKESEGMMSRYRVNSVPRIYLLDAEGHTYAETMYTGVGLELFSARMKDLQREKGTIHKTLDFIKQETEFSKKLSAAKDLFSTLERNGLLVGYEDFVEDLLRSKPKDSSAIDSISLMNVYRIDFAMRRAKENLKRWDGPEAVKSLDLLETMSAEDLSRVAIPLRQEALSLRAKALVMAGQKSKALEVIKIAESLDAHSEFAVNKLSLIKDQLEINYVSLGD